MRAPIGLRISSRRKILGLSQVALARQIEVSPSYLNLIEHNKRDIGGALLLRVARQLGIEVGELTGAAEHRLVADLEEAFADPILVETGLGAEAARDLVARDPVIASAIARLHRAYTGAVTEADERAERLRADPLFSQLLHRILSGITAVRSSAEILEDVPDLDDEERRRFRATISLEARNLTEVTRNLIGQFDRTSAEHRSSSPLRELDDLIFESDNYFPGLEDVASGLRREVEVLGPFGEASLTEALQRRFGVGVERRVKRAVDPLGFPGQYGFDAEAHAVWFHSSAIAATRQFQLARLYCELAAGDVLTTAASHPLLTSDDARRLAYRAMASYAAGTMVFPYERFLADAEAERYDIEALRQIYGASFEQVAHRLVTLRRPDAEGVPFGFIRSDPAGRLTKHFPLPGLLLPNAGHACPLWVLYAAFRTPETLMRQTVRFAGGARYLFVAKAVTRRTGHFVDRAVPISVMLACDVMHADRTVYGTGLDLTDAGAAVPVGPSCRLCTRTDCASRQEEMFAPGGGQTAIRAPLLPSRFDLGDPR